MVTSPTLTVNTQAWIAGWDYGGSGVVPISPRDQRYNGTPLTHHSFNNRNLPNMCRILVTMSASSLCLLSMSKLRKIIHNITGSTQSTYISAYISIIMEIWSAAHTVKMYENGQRSVKPTTNSAGDRKHRLNIELRVGLCPVMELSIK